MLDQSSQGVRDLVQMSQDLSNMIDGYQGEWVKYDCPGGPAMGRCIRKTEGFAIQECRMPEGCRFEPHPHGRSLEMVMVLAGRCRATIYREHEDSFDKHLGPSSMVYFLPAQVHTFKAITDAVMIGVTIPADEGYPDERPVATLLEDVFGEAGERSGPS